MSDLSNNKSSKETVVSLNDQPIFVEPSTSLSDPMVFHTKRHVASKLQKQAAENKAIPAEIHLCVISPESNGSTPSLMLVMSTCRYLFNCGEGTQRIIAQLRLKPSRLERIFVTHKSWKNIGGILGMVLTMNASNSPVVTLHGPPKIEDMVLGAHMFDNKNIDVIIDSHDIDNNYYNDGAMRIDYIKIQTDNTETQTSNTETTKTQTENTETTTKTQTENTETTTETQTGNTEKTPPQTDNTETTTTNGDSDKDSTEAMAYICKPHNKLRSVKLSKCLDLGVPIGKELAQLKRGEEVTLENGKIVKPDDVLGPVVPTQPFIVIECPDLSYLPSLINNQVWQKYTNDWSGSAPVEELTLEQRESIVDIIVHFTPPEVVSDPRYQRWMKGFGSKTKHLFLNQDCPNIPFTGTYKQQTQLNVIHPRLFPLLPVPSSDRVTDDQNVIHGCSGLTYFIRKANDKEGTFSRHLCNSLDFKEYTDEAKQNLGDIEAPIKDLNKDLPSSSSLYPELTFLGTGSACPQVYRNVSAFLVTISKDNYMLMDCGEGTAGQMVRFFGIPRVYEVLRNLKAVFVSHLHADHHMGLLGVMELRSAAYAQIGVTDVTPMLLIAPSQIKHWHNTIDGIVNSKSEKMYNYVYTSSLYKESNNYCLTTVERCADYLQLSHVQTVYMIHRQVPFGIIIEHKDGWRIAYSGDTVPCQRFIDAGKGCDLLVHEATMDDSLESDAKKKKHSTTQQAINVGLEMKAKFTLLTHFSQRYNHVPQIESAPDTNAAATTAPTSNTTATTRATGETSAVSNIGITFDNMRISLAELPELPLLYPSFRALFIKDINRMELTTLKKKQKMKQMKENTKKKNQQEKQQQQQRQEAHSMPNTKRKNSTTESEPAKDTAAGKEPVPLKKRLMSLEKT